MDCPPPALNIMLVDDQPPRAALLARSLEDAGQRVLCCLTSAAGLLEKILMLHPDLVLVDMDAPDRDVLESAAVVDAGREAVPRPLVTVAGAGDQATVITALGAGVSVYASDGLDPASVRAVVVQAAARYREYRALREALEQGAGDAAGQVVERARALLMSRRRIGERDADAALRRQAMRTGEPLSRVARSLLDCAELLKAGAPR